MTDRKSPSGIDRRSLLQGAALAAAAASSGTLGRSAEAAAPAAASAPTRSAPPFKAQAVNFKPVMHDNKASAAKMKSVIEAAGRDGVKLIVFPEMALQGFEKCQDCSDKGSACDKHLATGEYADGPLMRELARVVRRNDIYAVIGFGERDRTRPHLYNAAAMLGPEGLIGVNRKMGVGTGVKPAHGQSMFTSGDRITVFPTRYGPVGVGICYDVWMNPEIARIMMLKGAKIIAVPTATVGTTISGDIEKMAFTRARENVLFVINANLVGGGFEGELRGEPRFYSHSYIAGPEFPSMAKVLGKTDDPFGNVTAEIDLGQYDRFRAYMQMQESRMPTGYDANTSRVIAREYAAMAGMKAI